MAQSKEKKEEPKGCLPEILSHQCGDCTYYCCLCPPKSRISFGIWANMQAFVASFSLLATGILASSFDQTSNTTLYQIGRYIKYWNIPIALFVMFVEYPRGNKKGSGRVEERLFQSYIAPIHYSFRFFTRNYFLRSIVYILLAAPSQFSLATTLSGFMLIISSIFYFVAALYDECWTPPTLSWGRDSKPKENKGAENTMDMLEAPQEPPPRMPQSNSSLKRDGIKESEIFTNNAT